MMTSSHLPVVARAAIRGVRRDTAVFLALASSALALRSLGVLVPDTLVWVLAQQVALLSLTIGYARVILVNVPCADSLDEIARAIGRATPRIAYTSLRAALSVALLLALILLPTAPAAPLAPRLAPWAWWLLALLALIVLPVARRVPHRVWWLLDRRAYRAAPGWDDAAAQARAAVERSWAMAYPGDDRPRRALDAAIAFHDHPGRATGRAATRAARAVREEPGMPMAAARRHDRQSAAATWVARAVVEVVRVMQPDSDPRAWPRARADALDALRSAEDTLRQTLLDRVDETLADDFRLYLLLRGINKDPIVARFGLTLTPAHLSRWLGAFRAGVAYMARTYGDDSLPWGWGLVGGTARERWRFSRRAHMGYVPANDAVYVSAANLADQALAFGADQRFLNPKLSPAGVPAEQFVLLEAVEECYHAYQFKVLGMTGWSRRDDPIERDILPVWKRASADLGLGLRFVDDGK